MVFQFCLSDTFTVLCSKHGQLCLSCWCNGSIMLTGTLFWVLNSGRVELQLCMTWCLMKPYVCLFVCFWRESLQWGMASSLTISRSHTTRHSREHSSGWVISSSQRPLPDNTQHSRQTDIHVTGGIRTHNINRRVAADLLLRPRGQWAKP
jgi:hypothetical protein